MDISDAHNDFLTTLKTKKERQNYFKYLINNKKIKLINCVVWTSEFKNPLKKILQFKKEFDFFKKMNPNKIIFSLEDLFFIKNDKNLIYNLNQIIELKPFACGIVWNNDNELGGGAFGKKRLTPLGETVVKILENHNILIDTAHMNFKTFNDFCKITSKPIFNSHTNLYNKKRHKRNLKTKQIKSIVDSKGFIGLSFVADFISSKSIDSKMIARQVKSYIKKYDCDSVGIGSDFFGTNNLPKDLKNYSDLKNLHFQLKKIKLDKYAIPNVFHKNFLDFVEKLQIKKR